MKDAHEFRFVITPFCNYRCFFCHSEGLTEEYTPLLLSPRDYAFIANAGKKAFGWDTVTITGGEPLISPIYRETCELLKASGISITTVTNASLISSPRKLLKDNDQINISLHSMNPQTYRKITGTAYPLNQVIDTIIAVRAQMPHIKIHLNTTVIGGINDTADEIGAIINFANRIGAQAKFIDLASKNESLVVPVEKIEEIISGMGFTHADHSTWQTKMLKGEEEVIITRCGFGLQNRERGVRNLFVNPDGVVSTEMPGDLPLNVFKEIRDQDEEGFIAKVEWLYPYSKE